MAKAPKTPTWQIACYVAGMLLSGTVNTLTTKIQFTMVSTGIEGTEEEFRKPWFGTWNMLMAMAFVLFTQQLFLGFPLCRKGNSRDVPLMIDSPGGAPASSSKVPWRTKVCYVAAPAAFDLLATALCCMGILYIPASVWQILRGSSIIFCVLFSVFFLKRRMYCFNWIGLFLCVTGVCLVGLSGIWGSNASAKKTTGAQADSDAADFAFGMFLVVFGQVVQAAQVIAEEWLMKDVDLPATEIIGFEGMWGLVMMIVIVYPLLYIIPGGDQGSLESAPDTFVMISNSSDLLSMVIVYIISCATFNITGIKVTGALSAVHRMMMDASRTTVIWGFGLYVHYYVDADSKFGEQLTPYSYLQLIGFVVLVCGQATYGEVLKIPGLYYPPPADIMSVGFASPAAMMNLASPLPRERVDLE